MATAGLTTRMDAAVNPKAAHQKRLWVLISHPSRVLADGRNPGEPVIASC